MDQLKAQLDRIQKQLAGLTPSQRMLTAALVAIMVMTLVWWGRYAGEPEMEPVVNSVVTPDEVTRITSELAAKGIKYSISGGKVLVPVDRKLEAVGALSYSRTLPRDSKGGFEEMLAQMNPFLSQNTSDQMFNRGKEITLAQIIREFPGVSDAQVMIDPTQRNMIGGNIDPSATVHITTAGGAASQQLVNAAADVVEGAQAGLHRAKIKVVVNGKHCRVQDDENNDFDAGEQLDLQQKAEVRLADKVKEQLSYINGLMVSVTVKLNTEAISLMSTTYDPKSSVSKPRMESVETEENVPAAPASGEPGVATNTGASNTAVAIPGASGGGGAGGGSSNREKRQTTNDNYVSHIEKTSRSPAGETTPIGAAVRVPMSYFAAVYTHLHPDVKDPTDAVLKDLSAAELPKIKDDVLKCVGLTSQADVSVETYVDPSPATMVAAPSGIGAPVGILVGGHAKEIVLGVLAVLSLLIVSLMVRKSTPVPLPVVAAPAPPPGPTGPRSLDSGEQIAGAVGEGNPLLDGMELDDDAVRAQQMVDQVSTLVKENPEAAATLVNRWLHRT